MCGSRSWFHWQSGIGAGERALHELSRGKRGREGRHASTTAAERDEVGMMGVARPCVTVTRLCSGRRCSCRAQYSRYDVVSCEIGQHLAHACLIIGVSLTSHTTARRAPSRVASAAAFQSTAARPISIAPSSIVKNSAATSRELDCCGAALAVQACATAHSCVLIVTLMSPNEMSRRHELDNRVVRIAADASPCTRFMTPVPVAACGVAGASERRDTASQVLTMPTVSPGASGAPCIPVFRTLPGTSPPRGWPRRRASDEVR